MSQLRTIELPDDQEMQRRLLDVIREDIVVKRFFPLILQHAGRIIRVDALALELWLQAVQFTNEMPLPFKILVFTELLDAIVAALVDDEVARAQTLERLEVFRQAVEQS